MTQSAHEPTSGQAAHGHDHDDHHGGSIKTYLAVFVALCVLTMASFFTYSRFWPFNEHVAWAFMMAVSCTKAMLVVSFFMHLKYEASWKYVLTVPATFMSIFLVLMLIPDVGMRLNRASEERLQFMAISHDQDHHDDDHSATEEAPQKPH